MGNKTVLDTILTFQKQEITEYEIYKRLSKRFEGKNREILEKIANDEKRHYGILKNISRIDVKPNRFKILWYIFLSYIFGVVFTLKAMEMGEKIAQENYSEITESYPVITKIIEDEEDHEIALINLLEEERIGYISSMVLGLSDAIVELTGTLAGLTFALRNSKLVGLAGIITGVSAALSMAVSEYLSQKSDVEEGKSPLKASIYTGIAYILVVVMLVLPYFLIPNPYTSLLIALCGVVIVIAAFTYFVAVVKDQPYKSLFFEMIILSGSVMIISFIVGMIARKVLGVDI